MTPTQFVVISNKQEPLQIKYEFSAKYKGYLINGIDVYGKVVEKVLRKGAVVVVMFTGFDEYLPIMRALWRMGDDNGRKTVKTEYIHQAEHHNGSKSLSRGECDMPMAYNVVTVMKAKDYNYDSTDGEFLKAQQKVRAISLVHGGSFVVVDGDGAGAGGESVDGVGEVMKAMGYVDGLIGVVQAVPGMDLGLGPMLGPAESGPGPGIVLAIPRGWDSWNRIQLVARAIYHEGLFDNDSDVEEFIRGYGEALCSRDSTDNDLKEESEESDTTSYEDIVNSVRDVINTV